MKPASFLLICELPPGLLMCGVMNPNRKIPLCNGNSFAGMFLIPYELPVYAVKRGIALVVLL